MFDVIKKLKFFFKENALQYTLSFIALGLGNLCAVLIPNIVGRMIDDIVTNVMDMQRLQFYVISFIALIILTYLLDFSWVYGLFSGAYKLQNQMRSKMMRHLLRMRAPYFEKFRTGDLMARGTQDIRSLADTAGYGMEVLMTSTVYLSILIAMMGVSVSWALTAATILPMLPMVIVFRKKGAEIDERYETAQKSFSKVNEDVLEMVDGTRVIRAYVKEEDFIQKFRKQTEDLYNKNNRVAKTGAVFGPTVKFFEALSVVIALSYGAYLVASGVLTLGNMIAFQLYLGMTIWPLIAVSELILILRQGSASMRRVEEILDATDGLDLRGEETISEVEDIKFNQFDFRYTSSESINLENLDLDLTKGKMLGIVGKTGSGKTTLIRQLLNQYPAGTGSFEMGQHAYAHYQDPELRRMIGYVPQDHVLFSRSVRENIAFGKKGANDEEIMKSIRDASFEEDLKKMEHGLDTMIGEKGMSISGGQKQRISIARALIKDPQILILDDSLSAVDAKTEQNIISNIQQVRANKTTIITTHRLSAVKQADEIIVMDNGRIAERGTHEELIQQKGWYYEQFLRQEVKSKEAIDEEGEVK